jgi:oxygen-independent coproporphyrinogen-3 oxidase
MNQTLGLYLSIPFCTAKCSFCNFASGVFGQERLSGYVDRLLAELRQARAKAERLGAELPSFVDTLYLGGGTPSLLGAADVERLFAALREEFSFAPEVEATVECAPGQIGDATLATMLKAGVNRLSFGVQSFIDHETTAVGRLHTRSQCLVELERVRQAGVGNLGIDLIAGLPLQSEASFLESLRIALDSGVEHLSLYMLEVDEDSRLGREALSSGMRYKAAALPSEDVVAAWYLQACDLLAAHGVMQYEISNFAQAGFQSRHNRKYWQRDPYLGFGLDAHSMLYLHDGGAVRFANSADMEAYLADGEAKLPEVELVDTDAAFEESLFVGLRMVEGVALDALEQEFGRARMVAVRPAMMELADAGLLVLNGSRAALTPHGRIVSNEVFGRLLEPAPLLVAS